MKYEDIKVGQMVQVQNGKDTMDSYHIGRIGRVSSIGSSKDRFPILVMASLIGKCYAPDELILLEQCSQCGGHHP
jgi:hypothetical protein